MSASLKVRAELHAELNGAVSGVVASLPVSFESTDGAADVWAIGGEAGWTRRAMAILAEGPLGIVVVDPVPEPTAELILAAETAATAVVLDQRWASNPAVGSARQFLDEIIAGAVLLDSVATSSPGTDPEILLTQHLAMIQGLGVPLKKLQLVQRTPQGYVVAGHLPNGAPLALQGLTTSSRRPECAISVLTNDGGAEITASEPNAAWPAQIVITTPTGSTLLPSLYESAHRSTWVRLQRHISEGTSPTDLEAFAEVTAAVRVLAVHGTG